MREINKEKEREREYQNGSKQNNASNIAVA